MSKKSISRGTHLVLLQHLIEGLGKHKDTLPALLILGKSYSVAEIIAELQKRLDEANTVAVSKAMWQASVTADREGRAVFRPFLSALTQALRVAFSLSIDTLVDFGLAPHKTREPLSNERKAQSIEKAQATRKARHTMGHKQRAAIKVQWPAAPSPAPNGSHS